MGLTVIRATVEGAAGQKAKVDFLVDSGASYTLLPEKIWRRLKLKAKRRMPFSLADGRLIERDISECRISIQGEETHTPVILGVSGDEPLLGVITLEELGLVLNPFQRTLEPMLARLGSASSNLIMR